VLSGELKPANANEFTELAGFCGKFEKNYVLAARFANDALTADPKLYTDGLKLPQFAGWSAQAGLGNGMGAKDLTEEERTQLRKQSRKWLREAFAKTPKDSTRFLAYQIINTLDLAPFRAPAVLALFSTEEQTEWNQLWAELKPATKK
jgi:hypothetical protein